MRPTRTIAQVAFCLSTMGSLSAAWPTWLHHAGHALVGRQDNEGKNGPFSNGREMSQTMQSCVAVSLVLTQMVCRLRPGDDFHPDEGI